MIKIYNSTIIGTLFIILSNCIVLGDFPDIWKKSNIFPVLKNGDKKNC